jgi:hypothetical protein
MPSAPVPSWNLKPGTPRGKPMPKPSGGQAPTDPSVRVSGPQLTDPSKRVSGG